ncbi:MAG: carboxymuconolactone decarboxylase family protein [Deltaproteobacteria bacterium]|nr:carboxymuconolactone decarboxylase family protein [Deltaproteobacteria bacterium]
MKTDFINLPIFFFAAVFLSMITTCKSTETQFQSAQDQDPLPGGETAWTLDVDKSERSLINPPDKIPWFSGILLRQAEKEFEKELLPGRILTWSTDLGVASGCLEYFIEKGARKILDPRMLCLLRMQVSYFVSCAFAIDVNSAQYKDYRITEEELQGLQGLKELDTIESFTEKELVALKYAIALSKTPVSFSGKLLEDLRRLFSNKEIVAIASLSAKVNYWARVIEAWRIKPAGYTDDPLLKLEQYSTYE